MKAGTKARGTGNNKRIGGRIPAKLAVLAVISAISIILLAPALFADQAMLAKESGSMCGDYSWSAFDSGLSDIDDYGSYTSPELVDYDADGQLELVVSYGDGDIRTFQYNESASPKWQLDQLVLDDGTAETYRTISAIDFDKDGDYDLITSVNSGQIHYYENYGTRAQPNWTYKRAILNPDIYNYEFKATVDVVDFNRDGYYDILTGTDKSNGIINYYENVADEYAIRFEPFTKQFLDDIGSYTQCAFIDIDDEGVLDMICSRNSQTLYKFENKGNTTEAEWGDVEIFLNTGSGSQKYFSFGDLDNDTDYDLIVGDNSGNVYYYENAGTKQNPLFASGVDVFGFGLGTYTAPALVDIDDDGDLDMYVGEENNNELKFYNNTGNATDYSFTVIPSMAISVGADRPVPYAADLDNDGDYDLVVGVLGGQARFYENAGTAQSPSFSSYASLIDVGDYAAVGFGDIDNDSDLDMAIGNSRGYCMFYYNSGNSTDVSINSTIPQFDFSFMPENDRIHITMHDVDFDGDLDLILGRADEPDKGNYYGDSVWFYENTGSNLYPEFSEIAKWEDFSGSEVNAYAAMGDLDNDGDLDFIANTGTSKEYIKYYENVGNEFSYNWSGMTTNYLGIDIGSYSVPYAVDFDLDGDIDVIIGRYEGYINYMRNDGNSTEANFTDAGLLQNTSLVNIDVSRYSCPAAADMDADGDIDLIVSDRDSLHKIGYWQNNGSGYFSLANSDILSGKVGGNKLRPCPRLKDLDGDSDYDLVVGVDDDNRGYVYMILNTGTTQTPSWGSHSVLINESLGAGVGWLDEYVVPALYDINNDSVIDIIAGEYYGELLVFKHYDSNTSTTTDKVYNYFNGSFKYWWTPNWSLADTRAAPTFGDLNGDGLPDLLIGRGDGEVDYIENYGRFTDNASIMRNIAFIKQSDDMLGGYIEGEVRLGQMALDLYDIDNDNDLDVFVYTHYSSYMDYRSYLYLLRNTGTAETYLFNPDEAELIYYTKHFYCPTSSTAGMPYPTSLSIADFDSDGDGDISIGIGAYRTSNYGYGKTKLFINNGTIVEPSFKEIIAGEQRDCSSDSILPDQGWWPSSHLYDADNDGDMDAFVCTKRGYCILLENKGLYTDPDDIADNTRFIKKIHDLVGNVVSSGSSFIVAPRVVDFDGDGDYDIAVGSDGSESPEYSTIKYYKNNGTISDPSFELDSIQDLNDAHRYLKPAFGDIDNDGDNDVIYGHLAGVLGAHRNSGTYQNNTCITVINTTVGGESGVYVTFENSSGTICSVTTDSSGKAQCNISYNDDEIRIFVSGVNDPHRILASSYVDEGRSSMNAELELTGKNSKIALNRMLFNVFSPGDYQPSITKVYIGDSKQTMFNGVTNSSGILNAWLPTKYLVFMNEPYTKNRITYDIEVFGNEKYDRVLSINDIYTPNEINLSSSTESRKLYKFAASEQMATGARYKVHVLYPAYTAQQKYNITDTVNGNLTIIGNVTVSYMGESCSIDPGTSSYSVDYTDLGCDFLEDAVEGNGEWVKVEYIIETPSLATFESEGWTTQDFISDPATIRLIS